MNLIDHRILIPTSPERVWHFVGDLKRNPEWQANCRTISVLTSTPKTQPGTRLRITPERGREYVIEITAWYERFGYEYIVAEGANFRDNKGTVRLQEVPEGTIVQWTFSYRPGLFGGGGARTQEALIIDSLRRLYKLITKSKEVETFQAKSLMRDDPGVEARATYRPRHPFGSTAEGSAGRVKGAPRQPTQPQPSVAFPEPAIKPDDTKPRPVVIDTPAASAPPAPADAPSAPPAASIPPVPYTPSGQVVEPDFLIDEPYTPGIDVPSERVRLPVTPASEEDSAPIKAVVQDELPAVRPITDSMPAFAPPKPVEPADPIEPPKPVESAPVEPPVLLTDTRQHSPPQPEPLADTAPKSRQDTTPIATTYPTPAEAPVVKPISTPKRDKLMDTAKISVFDVFGLPKPSETQEIRALATDASGDPIPVESPMRSKAAASEEALSTVPTKQATPRPETRRHGRRALLRRASVKLRYPT